MLDTQPHTIKIMEEDKPEKEQQRGLLSRKRKHGEEVTSPVLTIEDIPKIASLIKEELKFPTRNKISVEENNTRQKIESVFKRVKELAKIENIKEYTEWKQLVDYINSL